MSVGDSPSLSWRSDCRRHTLPPVGQILSRWSLTCPFNHPLLPPLQHSRGRLPSLDTSCRSSRPSSAQPSGPSRTLEATSGQRGCSLASVSPLPQRQSSIDLVELSSPGPQGPALVQSEVVLSSRASPKAAGTMIRSEAACARRWQWPRTPPRPARSVPQGHP